MYVPESELATREHWLGLSGVGEQGVKLGLAIHVSTQLATTLIVSISYERVLGRCEKWNGLELLLRAPRSVPSVGSGRLHAADAAFQFSSSILCLSSREERNCSRYLLDRDTNE